MNKQDTYLEAARLAAQDEIRDPGKGACSAIAEAMYAQEDRYVAFDKAHNSDEVNNFIALFQPAGSAYGYWGNEWGNDDEERKECRVLALCFMAAMAAR